jgi:hypothetical protein
MGLYTEDRQYSVPKEVNLLFYGTIVNVLKKRLEKRCWGRLRKK